MKKLTTDEEQYLLDVLKNRYDDLYWDQRNKNVDWEMYQVDLDMNARIQDKLLGHEVGRHGYKYI